MVRDGCRGKSVPYSLRSYGVSSLMVDFGQGERCFFRVIRRPSSASVVKPMDTPCNGVETIFCGVVDI